MLRSIGTKDGTILYHIGYGAIIGCPTISGVTSCGQPKCWLTGIGLVTKLGCIWVCCTCAPTWVASAIGTTCYRKVLSSSLINLFNFSSQKEFFWIHVQTFDNMHKLMQLQQ